MPDNLACDAEKQRLLVGGGYVDAVPPAVWHYPVSGKQVLVQWFGHRRKNRERPIIGDGRQPSPLGDLQPDHGLAEYTTELLKVLNVLGQLVDLEPQAAELLERICSGPLVTQAELQAAGAFFPEGFASATAPAQSRLDLQACLEHDAAMTRDELLALLAQHKPVLAERFGVTSLRLFGSFARGTAREDSDVDVLVRFDGPATSKRYFGVQFYLEDLLHRPVDLVTEQALRERLRPYVERDAIHV